MALFSASRLGGSFGESTIFYTYTFIKHLDLEMGSSWGPIVFHR